MINISFDVLIFILWIIIGIISIIGGLTDDEKKVPVLNYILLWIVFLVEMFSKILITGGFKLGQ